MKILLTNDDGIHALGLTLVAEAASRFGEVTVVAPETEKSGTSHAITLHAPLRIREIAKEEFDGRVVRRFVSNGTPTDCVYIALHYILGGEGAQKPGLVISGINPGPNLAHDTLYSGTVAAALEGAHWGIPSLALSHCARNEDALRPLRTILPSLLKTLIPEATRVTGTALNVNLPPTEHMPYAGIVATRLGSRIYSNEIIERTDPRGGAYYWIGGRMVHMADIDGSDCNAIRDNFISVTPLANDLTRRDHVATLASALRSNAHDPIGPGDEPAHS